MASSLEDVRQAVLELPDPDRQLLAEEIIAARWNPQWRSAWIAEIERRQRRLETGEDRELTLDEFWADAATD